MRCPICDKQFSLDDENAALPFCSVRCKSIDAKRWLNEEYTFETVNLDRLEEEIAGLEAETAEEPGEN
ncbi:MAG: DNA gyrase inhibitor YacG [Thermoguttaceae bacterium]|nr:DNA gyrase inhibitor YacG [Thermoguttaceae bacterium]